MAGRHILLKQFKRLKLLKKVRDVWQRTQGYSYYLHYFSKKGLFIKMNCSYMQFLWRIHWCDAGDVYIWHCCSNNGALKNYGASFCHVISMTVWKPLTRVRFYMITPPECFIWVDHEYACAAEIIALNSIFRKTDALCSRTEYEQVNISTLAWHLLNSPCSDSLANAEQECVGWIAVGISVLPSYRIPLGTGVELFWICTPFYHFFHFVFL